MSSTIKFNPNTQECTELASMATPRCNFGACVVEDEIFIAGGNIYDEMEKTILDSVEIYNIQNNQWRQGPKLPYELDNVGLFLMSGSLFAYGIFSHCLVKYNRVMRLDLQKMQWEVMEVSLEHLREGLLSVLSRLFHARDRRKERNNNKD